MHVNPFMDIRVHADMQADSAEQRLWLSVLDRAIRDACLLDMEAIDWFFNPALKSSRELVGDMCGFSVQAILPGIADAILRRLSLEGSMRFVKQSQRIKSGKYYNQLMEACNGTPNRRLP